MQNLLVTGGAGFIASTFVAKAIEAGDNVIVLDALTYAGHRENLSWIKAEPSQLELVVGDICDRDLVSKLLKDNEIDLVFNFAAESHVDNSISSPGDFVETNVNGTFQMLEAARAYYSSLSGAKKDNFRFVQVSTDEVYGSLGADDPAFNEETNMKPNSPYSASKAAGDHLARAWFHTYDLPTIITNCSNNYGARQYPEKLIPHMITRALSGQSLPIYGDGKNVRDWIHVEDHSGGVYLAAIKGQAGETYCFGGHAERTNNETVEAICTALDELHPRADGKLYSQQIEYVKDRAGHDMRYAIDDTKAQFELGFTRLYAFEDGIKQTVKWYLDNSAWCEAVTGKKSEEAA